MVKRVCDCGTAWYSADSSGTWTCVKCGQALEPERNEDAEGAKTNG